MGRMWRGGYRRFHPIGDRMGNEMVDAFDVGQPICDLDMKYRVYKVPAKEVIPYRIYPVLSPVWKADGYDELGIIYDRYLDLLVTYVVEGESETDGYAAAIVTYDNLDTFGLPRGKLFEYASRNLKSDIRIGFTGTTGQLAMLEIGRLSGGCSWRAWRCTSRPCRIPCRGTRMPSRSPGRACDRRHRLHRRRR